ncbi:MAG: DUF1918 domain-containing protein [Acidimicrobiales bacterium]
MKAKVGDRIVVRGPHVGDHGRDGEVLEVHGEDGGPPYVVRWDTDGHESTYWPSSDSQIEHVRRRR